VQSHTDDRTREPDAVTHRLWLIACSDDFLLEGAVAEETTRMRAELGVDEHETVGEDTTPEAVAVEVFSPSLFSPQRVLVVPNAIAWVEAKSPPGAPARPAGIDVGPLVRALDSGVPDGIALILGVWSAGKPKGPLVDVVKRHGSFTWVGLPPAPKPWEDVVVSAEQAAALRRVLRDVAPEARLAAAAERLLFDRLGFAPRQLAQEVQKLVAAAGDDGVIDEDLVRRLTFPRERSLEVVQDAVLDREVSRIVDLLAAAGGGLPVRDWRGERLDAEAVPLILVGQVAGLLVRLLYVRRCAVEMGVETMLDPRQTSDRGWYSSRFKGRVGSELLQRIVEDPGAPWPATGRKPSEWTLGNLFKGAGRYRDDELVAALDAAGRLESAVRGPTKMEAVSAWIATLAPV
jgi:hypothetical protein